MKMENLYFLCLVLFCSVCLGTSVKAQLPVTVNTRAVTSAETDAANPSSIDASDADIQVLKTEDGSADRESYLKFDISAIESDNLSFASIRTTGGQHNGDAEMVNPYYVEIYACAQTDWSRADLTWNTAQSFTIGENPLAMINIQGFGVYDFYSPDLVSYIIDQKDAGADFIAFKLVAKDVQPFDSWVTGSWDGGASNLILCYSEPDKIIPSVTTAETDKANPDEIDAVVDDPNDIQIWKTIDGTEERESYVKFDISELSPEYLKYAVISCYGGQHNGDFEMAEANWVQVYSCENTDWSRDDLTWNIAESFTIGENPLASSNIQGFGIYKFSSPAISQYLIDAKTAGKDTVAFKFVARDVQEFDSWLSGAWNGMNLNIYQGDRNTEAVQDDQTAEAYAATPDTLDDVPNDIKVQLTENGTTDYEGFVSFDISSIETPSLVYASIAFKAGQHAPEGEEVLDKYIVDLYPMRNTDWVAGDITWNSTRSFVYVQEPVASVNIWGFGDYYFVGEELAGYINSQVEAGASKVAFIMKGREVTPWNAWLSGDWNGMHLSWADPSQALPADTENPTDPTDLEASPGTTSIGLSWTESTDNREIAGYKIYNAGAVVGTVNAATTAYTVSNLEPETEYTLGVAAFDKAGNLSGITTTTISTAAEASFEITIDGALDADWEQFEMREITWLYEPGTYVAPESDADCKGEFRMAWSPDGLYLYIEVFDNVRDIDAAANYLRDHIEINFDPQNNKPSMAYSSGQAQLGLMAGADYTPEYYIADPGTPDNTNVSTLVSAFLEKGNSYVFELYFPWASPGFLTIPTVGHIWGFNITISDDDGEGRETVLGFAESELYPWNDPSAWATMELLAGGHVGVLEDNEAPSQIQEVNASVDGNNITLTWSESTDNIGVVSYNILDENLEIVATVDGSETSFVITGKAIGNYYYTVVARDAAGNTSDINYDAVATAVVTSINDQFSISKLKIYPVPAKEVVHIESSNTLKIISLFDVSGSKILDVNANDNRATLNIAHLNSGIYFLKITDEKGFNTVSKVIKE